MRSRITEDEETVFVELVGYLHEKSSSSKSLGEEGSLDLFKEVVRRRLITEKVYSK